MYNTAKKENFDLLHFLNSKLRVFKQTTIILSTWIFIMRSRKKVSCRSILSTERLPVGFKVEASPTNFKAALQSGVPKIWCLFFFAQAQVHHKHCLLAFIKSSQVNIRCTQCKLVQNSLLCASLGNWAYVCLCLSWYLCECERVYHMYVYTNTQSGTGAACLHCNWITQSQFTIAIFKLCHTVFSMTA